MSRDQLLALRSVVKLAEHSIGNMRRGPNRLAWTRELRKARQAIREVTSQHIESALQEVPHA